MKKLSRKGEFFCVLEIGDWGRVARYQAEMTYSAVWGRKRMM